AGPLQQPWACSRSNRCEWIRLLHDRAAASERCRFTRVWHDRHLHSSTFLARHLVRLQDAVLIQAADSRVRIIPSYAPTRNEDLDDEGNDGSRYTHELGLSEPILRSTRHDAYRW